MAGKGKIQECEQKNTNGFDKNPQNINRKGRPLKIYSLIKKTGYSKDDLNAAFNELIFYTLEDLEKAFDNDKLPIITRIVAHQLYSAYKDSNWTKIKEIIEYVNGKPAQGIDFTSGGEAIQQITGMEIK